MVKVIGGTSDPWRDMKERKRLHCEQELFGSVLYFKYRRQSEKDCEAEKRSSRENQEEEIRTDSLKFPHQCKFICMAFSFSSFMLSHPFLVDGHHKISPKSYTRNSPLFNLFFLK